MSSVFVNIHPNTSKWHFIAEGIEPLADTRQPGA